MNTKFVTLIIISLLINNYTFAQKAKSAKDETSTTSSSSSFKKIGEFYDPENLSISPDNTQIAFSCDGNSGDALIILDLQSNREILNKQFGGYKWVSSVKYSPTGKYILYSVDGTLYFRTKKDEFNKSYPNYNIVDFAFTPDEGFVVLVLNNEALFGDAFIVLYDIKNAKDIYTINFNSFLSKVIVSNSGKYIITYEPGTSNNAKIFILDIRTGSTINSYSTGYQFELEKMNVASNDSTLFTSTRQNNILKIWNTFTGEIKQSLKTQEYNSDFTITPDNRYIISYFDEKDLHYLYIFDLEKNINLSSIEFKYGGTSIAISNDYKYIILGMGALGLYKLDLSNLITRSSLYYKSYEDLNKKLRTEYNLNKERDEFETIDRYFDRAELFNQNIIDTKKNFIIKIIEEESVKTTESDKKNNEVMEKIKNSIKDTLLSISNVGYFNIDQQYLPVTINKITNNISLSTEEAKSLKENYKLAVVRAKKKLKYNLNDWEIFEITIVHPISFNKYIFSN